MSSMVVNTIQKNLGVMLTRHDENYNGSRKLQKPFLGLSSFRQSSFSIIHSIRGPTFAGERWHSYNSLLLRMFFFLLLLLLLLLFYDL